MEQPRSATAAPEPAEPSAGGASAGEADVRLTGISKRYGEVVAIDHIDLEVQPGEFFTMLGPSGSGKTTTLRMIAGFDVPDTGRVEIAGRDVTDLPAYDREVNTVFGGLLAFALSFDEIIVTTFTVGAGDQTLPIWILTNFSRPNQLPIVNVVAVLVILLSVIPVYLAHKLSSEVDSGGGVGAPTAAAGVKG